MPPSSTSRDQLLMLLGELKEGLKGVKDDIAEIKQAAADERVSAAASRQRIYEKLEDGESRIIKLESTLRITTQVVDNASHRLDAIEPTVKRSAASLKAWTIRGGLILTAIAAVAGFVFNLVQSNWGLILHFLESLQSN